MSNGNAPPSGGGGNGRPPGKDPNVIDIDQVFNEWRDKVFRSGGDGGGGGGRSGGGGGPNIPPQAVTRVVFGGVALMLLIFGVLSSVYTVPQDSEALVLRFGKLASQNGPGLHFKVPFGVDKVLQIPVKRVLKQEFGFSTISAGVSSEYRVSEENHAQAVMLTGDLNIANVEWIVQYRVEDPVAFAFRVRKVEETLSDVSEAIIRRVVGDRSVTEVLTVGRIEIAEQVRAEMQDTLTAYDTGIEIVTVQLQDVRPPGPVEDSFNEVNEAKQEKERMINEAETLYNQAIPAAQGESARAIAEAEGYALDRVNRSQGDANRFNAMYEEYKKAKAVTRRRIYLETMNEVLPNVGRLIVLDADTPVTPFIGFDEPRKAAVAAGGK